MGKTGAEIYLVRKPPIVLLTDFGIRDAYVASMKGVILSLAPEATLVDFTHEIEPQNVTQAASLLELGYPYFPVGSIFVCVVDPGVGSQRRILTVKTPRGFFLAPDNGLLTRVLQREKRSVLRFVSNRRFFLPKVSHTFHGRDCFAPAGARLWKKPALFSEMGPQTKRFVRLSFPEPRSENRKIRGEVLFFDHFGNAFVNISRELVREKIRGTQYQVRLKGKPLGLLRRTYSEVGRGQAVALFSSSDLLEIAVNQGSARNQLRLREGMKVEIERAS